MTDLTPEGVTLRVQTLDVVMDEPTGVPIETEPMCSLVEQVLNVLRVGRKLKRRLETLRRAGNITSELFCNKISSSIKLKICSYPNGRI